MSVKVGKSDLFRFCDRFRTYVNVIGRLNAFPCNIDSGTG